MAITNGIQPVAATANGQAAIDAENGAAASTMAPDVVMIDNYDSFTHNLYQSLCLLGAEVTVYRSEEITLDDLIAKHPSPSHLVISPGPGHPLRDSGISIPAIRHYAGKVPILGVCMGLQCIYASYGGVVDLAGEIVHGKTSAIVHDGKGLFKNVRQRVQATRYHSLAGKLDTLPDALEVTSRTEQSTSTGPGGIVMGIRHREHVVEAVQYHPESILSEEDQAMMANFLSWHGGRWSDNPAASIVKAAPAPRKASSEPLPTILTKIAAQRRVDVEAARSTHGTMPHDLDSLIALHVPPPAINLYRRLKPTPGSSTPAASHVALMAEVKRASPSKGDILPPHSPLSAPAIALEYARAGASVISVLTEPKWFKGSLEDMRAVRAAVDSLPHRPAILRKDFILDRYQVDEARVYGADTLLLIVAMLDDETLRDLYEYTIFRGMEPLVEVNNAAELDRALSLGARVIGVNNRNLHDFEVDMSTTSRLADTIRERGAQDVILCALSGIGSRADVTKYVEQGVGAVLVGEALMRASDKRAFAQSLLGTTAQPSLVSVPDGIAGPSAPQAAEPSTRPLVKICGIKTVEAAQTAVDAGADFISMIFVPGRSRNVPIEVAQQIVAAVRTNASPAPSTVDSSDWFKLHADRLRNAGRPLLCGVFQNPSLDFLLRTVDTLSLDVVQLHGSEPLEWTRLIGRPVIRAFSNDLRDIARPDYHAVALLDAGDGGSGELSDWTKASEIGIPLMLAGGLTPDNVGEAIRQVRPWAVDVSSGVETNGVKDLGKIRAFIRAAKGSVQ